MHVMKVLDHVSKQYACAHIYVYDYTVMRLYFTEDRAILSRNKPKNTFIFKSQECGVIIIIKNKYSPYSCNFSFQPPNIFLFDLVKEHGKILGFNLSREHDING